MPSRIERASSGEDAARAALLARHAEKLRCYVTYRLGRALARRVEVEDVVQETFLRAWRDAGKAHFSGEGAFAGWLARIARNVIADVARAARGGSHDGPSRRLAREAWSSVGGVDPADPAAGPVTHARLGELRGRLRTAFEALSPRHQRVIVLRQFEQRSAREAAQHLGCDHIAVHALFRRALAAWASELERGGHPTA
jgi:RNA polymerase sigma-70 factor (ECF subfamily)